MVLTNDLIFIYRELDGGISFDLYFTYLALFLV